MNEAACEATVDKRVHLEEEEEVVVVVAFSDQNVHIVSEEKLVKIVVTYQILHHLFFKLEARCKVFESWLIIPLFPVGILLGEWRW